MPSIRIVENLKTDGELDRKLKEWREDEGLTLRAIARKLEDEYGLDVTPETVRQWLRELAREAS